MADQELIDRLVKDEWTQKQVAQHLQRMVTAVRKGQQRVSELNISIGLVRVTPPDADSEHLETDGVETWVIKVEPIDGPARFTKQ